jgi:hypothetical protein
MLHDLCLVALLRCQDELGHRGVAPTVLVQRTGDMAQPLLWSRPRQAAAP